MSKKEVNVSLKSILVYCCTVILSFGLVFYLETTKVVNCDIIWVKNSLNSQGGIQSYSATTQQYYHSDFETYFGNIVENDREYFSRTRTVSFQKEASYMNNNPVKTTKEEFIHPLNLNSCYAGVNEVFIKATVKDSWFVLFLSMTLYFLYFLSTRYRLRFKE